MKSSQQKQEGTGLTSWLQAGTRDIVTQSHTSRVGHRNPHYQPRSLLQTLCLDPKDDEIMNTPLRAEQSFASGSFNGSALGR